MFIPNEKIYADVLSSKGIKDGAVIRFKEEMHLNDGKVEKGSLAYLTSCCDCFCDLVFLANRETVALRINFDNQENKLICDFEDDNTFTFEDKLEIIDIPDVANGVQELKKYERKINENRDNQTFFTGCVFAVVVILCFAILIIGTEMNVNALIELMMFGLAFIIPMAIKIAVDKIKFESVEYEYNMKISAVWKRFFEIAEKEEKS